MSCLGVWHLTAFTWAIFLYGNLERDSLDGPSYDAKNLLDKDCESLMSPNLEKFPWRFHFHKKKHIWCAQKIKSFRDFVYKLHVQQTNCTSILIYFVLKQESEIKRCMWHVPLGESNRQAQLTEQCFLFGVFRSERIRLIMLRFIVFKSNYEPKIP